MGKIYKLSPEVTEQLSAIAIKSRHAFIIFVIVMLVFNFAFSGALYMIGYLELVIFWTTSLLLVGLLLFYSYRNPAFIRRSYSSYEIELSDQSITFRQNSKPTIEINQHEVAQIREILPESEIFIKGKKRGQWIDIYALLLKDNLDLKEELAKWQEIETARLAWTKISQPLSMALLGFLALALMIQSFSNPNIIILGLFALGYSVISFFFS